MERVQTVSGNEYSTLGRLVDKNKKRRGTLRGHIMPLNLLIYSLVADTKLKKIRTFQRSTLHFSSSNGLSNCKSSKLNGFYIRKSVVGVFLPYNTIILKVPQPMILQFSAL